MSEILDRIYPDNESQLFFTEIADHRKYIIELEQQLQQAHRQGWEQCQREAVGITDKIGFAAHSRTDAQNCCAEIADAIASMEYKEAEDD